MRPLRLPPVLLPALLLALGCRPTTSSEVPGDTPPPVASPAPRDDAPVAPPVDLDADEAQVRAHVEFLAADAQGGRLPGTDDDRRVQDYVEAQMKAAGLQPGFGGSFRQAFSVTDGVRPTSPTALTRGRRAIAHAVVPFSTSTAAPVQAKLVFVGYGIAPEGKGSGDYKGIESRVEGSIVVAMGGSPPDNPHLSPSVTRPQSKLIAARDHGAVGFILWEPDQEVAYPNHGAANDLKLPAVWVGKEGTNDLLATFGKKPGQVAGKVVIPDIPSGRRSRKAVTLSTPIEPITLKTANVSGILPGVEGGKVVVVGAHMDHLGSGTSTSLAPGVEAVHNGADDNASGVAVILEMARVLGALPPAQRPFTLVFVAFGAEEMGLLGSKHYVEALDKALRGRMVAMLNFDMVGRLGAEQGLVVAGMGTSSIWPDLVDKARGDQEVRASDDGYGASDQTSFYEDGLPVLHFFTGTHSDYHKPSDDIDKINFAGATRIASIATRVVHTLSTEDIAPDFIKVERKAPTRGGFRVSLGTIPDYGAKVDGVRLTGVREGGAAAKAGLQKGDVIQKIGDREIHNLDDYMATFAVLSPGEVVDVVVERDGQPVTLKMTPEAPKRRH
ncbi:MAG: M28 family peptidase [Myxococcota bacterium]